MLCHCQTSVEIQAYASLLVFTHLLVGKHTAGFFRQDLQSLDLLKDPNQDLEGFLQKGPVQVPWKS